MAGEPQGLATFPGVKQIVSASYSNTLGIRPGVLSFAFAPQPGFDHTEGDAAFSFGSQRFTVRDCKLDLASLERNDGGEVWRIMLWDRRWKWTSFGGVSGRYNKWRDDFTLQDGTAPAIVPLTPEAAKALQSETMNTERTPQQLAELCLEAMGEKNYHVKDLPNDTRPEVEWEYEPPAQALADLCESLGCAVSLQLDNSIRIVVVGKGAKLPAGGVLVDSYSIDAPEIPDSIAIVCGPTRFEVDFMLEAVGIDSGRKLGQSARNHEEMIRRIDDLSYKPAAGWSTIGDLVFFTEIGTVQGGEDVTGFRALAIKSLFRYYRIWTPVNIPGYGKPPTRKRYKTKDEIEDEKQMDGSVRFREQILPIYPESLDLNVVSISLEPGPAYVYGAWFDGMDGLKNTLYDNFEPPPTSPPNKVPGSVYRTPFYLGGFQIDAARGLVIFSDQVFRNVDPAAKTQGAAGPTKLIYGPARLILRASCNVRNRKTGSLERYVRWKETGSKIKTGTRFISRDEIVLAQKATYKQAGYASGFASVESGKAAKDTRAFETSSTGAGKKDPSSNLKDVEKACDHYLEAAQKEYDLDESQQKNYAGLLPTSLDGAIKQVIYSVGPEGCKTTICRNSEDLDYTISYKERRRLDSVVNAQEAHRAEMKKKHLASRAAIDDYQRKNNYWSWRGTRGG